MDVIYRFDESFEPPCPPSTPVKAVARLLQGNDDFVKLSTHAPDSQESHVIHLPPSYADPFSVPDSITKQEPFAIVLGCSDARVPVEIVFNQPRNQMFIVRVAGNVLGSVCQGSIEYAVTHLAHNLRLVVVLGHGSCGAVTAAVDAFLDPAGYKDIAFSLALQAIVDRIIMSVRAASRTLGDIWGPEIVDRTGYREALIEVSVGLNAAMTAQALRAELPSQILERVDVMFGVFDLLSRQVWAPLLTDNPGIAPGLAAAPSDLDSLRTLGRILGKSASVRTLLEI